MDGNLIFLLPLLRGKIDRFSCEIIKKEKKKKNYVFVTREEILIKNSKKLNNLRARDCKHLFDLANEL